MRALDVSLGDCFDALEYPKETENHACRIYDENERDECYEGGLAVAHRVVLAVDQRVEINLAARTVGPPGTERGAGERGGDVVGDAQGEFGGPVARGETGVTVSAMITVSLLTTHQREVKSRSRQTQNILARNRQRPIGRPNHSSQRATRTCSVVSDAYAMARMGEGPIRPGIWTTCS